MGRVIINNTSPLTDIEAVSMVGTVMKQGKISSGRFGVQYCHLTTFEQDDGDAQIRVWSTKTETGTYSFDVYIDAKELPEEQRG